MDQTQIDELKKEVKEDDSTKDEKICELKQTLKNHPFLVLPNLNDAFAISSLRSSKYNIQRVVKKFETFGMMLKDYQEYLSWEPEYMKICYEMLSEGLVVPLQARDSLGRKLILIDLGKRDPKVFSFADLLRTMSSVLTMIIQDDELTSLTGVVMIFDGSNVSLQHTPSLKDVKFLVKSSSISVARIKTMIMYKLPTVMSATLKLMNSIQSKKMRQRVQIVDNLDDLHRIMEPSSILPEYYNGKQDMMKVIQDAQVEWKSEICQKRLEFMQNATVNWDNVPKRGWIGF